MNKSLTQLTNKLGRVFFAPGHASYFCGWRRAVALKISTSQPSVPAAVGNWAAGFYFRVKKFARPFTSWGLFHRWVNFYQLVNA